MTEWKTPEQIGLMAKAGAILAACRSSLIGYIKPGVTTLDIDGYVERFLAGYGATPEQKGYRGYPYATCASVNEVACHGMPGRKLLREGDIVTIDMVVNKDGWLADSAWTFAVGEVSASSRNLMRTAKNCLYAGISQAKTGSRIGDIAHAIQSVSAAGGYSILSDFTGHGIGTWIHEWPSVPHTGKRGKGVKLEEGMVITIEPILTAGKPKVKIEADGWTATAVDGKWSAQYEHTVAITRKGPLILTVLQPVLYEENRA
ncbi:type I methionyl aminopeptidase [Paenibacillus ginsengarvi]|uniref:Methionine aminopeptidase n=1 Tax=Paenibacillus ginsengarvi TaxID=400777 RepID=A0A3B0CDM0_9BACL|nr:type I methionyl aminopeptidase [Paenibacillus ginsengarvi]RKN82119.1 type I methionyl aminopeptidase [Paenibacillus ginsengarvi]